MAELNKELPYDHAHGLVQDHEPYFFQNGCAFTQSGTEVFKDEMGNFSRSTPLEEVAEEVVEEPKPAVKAKASAKTVAVAEIVPEPTVEPVVESAPETVAADDII